jgi:methylenetetrahydrofolate reductase (NADPH)
VSNFSHQTLRQGLIVRTLTNNYSVEITAKEGVNFQAVSGAIPPGANVAIGSLPLDHLGTCVQAAIAVREAGLVPVPHLAARRIATAHELNTLLYRLSRQAAVDSVFVIAGDLCAPRGPFSDALSLIRCGTLSQHRIRKIGIAGHPEGHPDISSEKLWQAILAKRDVLAAMNVPYEIVTQFSFDSDAILDWLKRIRDAGILAPVKISIAGPASIKSMIRFASVCGVNTSAKVVAKYGFSLAALLGQTAPDALVADLEDKFQTSVHGEARLHFHTFGGVTKTVDWIQAYRQKRLSISHFRVAENGREAI